MFFLYKTESVIKSSRTIKTASLQHVTSDKGALSVTIAQSYSTKKPHAECKSSNYHPKT